MYQASVDDSIDGSTIPTMWGTDAVHGHNNVIGATLFPHNIGLGAMNNPQLIEQIATVTATEVMVTGIDWVFAPTVAVVRDDRWGRTYEGYSEDPSIVKVYAAAIVRGLQGAADKDFLGDGRVIATVKHFLGDGGTENGVDQGNNFTSEQDLFDLHAQGYVAGLTAGAQTVMVSLNSWHGKKNHGNKYLLTDVLKTKMGFDGLVVGDWNGHGQVTGCTNESCPQSINAGLDIFMVPTAAWKPLYENTIAQVKSGEITQARIDDAVTRILRVKMRAGLFDKPSPANRAYAGKKHLIGSKEHRAVAAQAVRESLVLLKKKDKLLPLSLNQHILVTGDGADNIGKQSGGWSITWQGTNNYNRDFPGGSSMYDGLSKRMADGSGSIELSSDGSFIQKPDVAIVVFGEEPYAEGLGDIDNLEYQQGLKQDLALLKSLKSQGIKTVSIFLSGRPLWVNAELNASDAFVAAWLPGSEGFAVADVLLRKVDGAINHDFVGKLSFSWPATPNQTAINRYDKDYQPLLPYGYGLRYGEQSALTDNLSVEKSTQAEKLSALTLFLGSVKPQWQLTIADGKSTQVMNSSVVENDVVHLRTIDRNVQEDARRVIFNGTRQGSMAFSSQTLLDLSVYQQSQSSLSFTVRKTQQSLSSAPVLLSIQCGNHCQGAIDISAQLNQLVVNEWQDISVDLQCFFEQGVNFSKVSSPFVLTTSNVLTLDFFNISVIPNSAKQANITCQ